MNILRFTNIRKIYKNLKGKNLNVPFIVKGFEICKKGRKKLKITAKVFVKY